MKYKIGDKVSGLSPEYGWLGRRVTGRIVLIDKADHRMTYKIHDKALRDDFWLYTISVKKLKKKKRKKPNDFTVPRLKLSEGQRVRVRDFECEIWQEAILVGILDGKDFKYIAVHKKQEWPIGYRYCEVVQ